jgi:hypothetical protein
VTHRCGWQSDSHWFVLSSTAISSALLFSACGPSGDLDAHARGSVSGLAEMGASPLPAGSNPSDRGVDGMPAQLPGAPAGSGGADASATDPAIASPAVTTAGPSASEAADAEVTGPEMAEPEMAQPEAAEPEATDPPPPVPAAPLPDDLIDAPVAGEIVFSDEAEWEVDDVFEPTVEIHTPTASYWVVKPLGTIVSIEDRQPARQQWIAFSSAFRPRRGVPSFPTPPATRVTTVRDEDSQTPTHLRLTSLSEDGLWHWVWDFYVTHVTFTVNRAPLPFGFAYQGVPGGSLGVEDRLVSNGGVSQGARSSFNQDLAGPVEWAFLADSDLGVSIFAVQHGDDALPEHYQVRDNDTALLLFGNGLIDVLPMRFSLGLVASVDAPVVAERIDFISRSIH